MNRAQRRAAEAKGQTFVANCALCKAADGRGPCTIHVVHRHGKKDLGICKGCPCSVERCIWCERTGEHWLGCPAVGLPSETEGAVLQ